MLKYTLLGFLSYMSLTGYELENYMAETTAYFWHARLSQIYATLKKLEEDGLVTSHVEPQEDRPDRRVYDITDNGREDLRQWLAQPMTEREDKKDTLLLKLFFSAQVGKQAILMQLRLQRNLHQQQLQHYRQMTPALIVKTLEEQPQLALDAVMWEASRRHGELFEEMYVRWLDETIQTVESLFPLE